MALTAKQRAHLKSLAHPLKPLFQVGREGVTPSVIGTIESALETRELMKVKVLEGAPVSAREAADELVGTVENMDVVQVIGRTIVLYRPHPEKPEIRLPRPSWPRGTAERAGAGGQRSLSLDSCSASQAAAVSPAQKRGRQGVPPIKPTWPPLAVTSAVRYGFDATC